MEDSRLAYGLEASECLCMVGGGCHMSFGFIDQKQRQEPEGLVDLQLHRSDLG